MKMCFGVNSNLSQILAVRDIFICLCSTLFQKGNPFVSFLWRGLVRKFYENAPEVLAVSKSVLPCSEETTIDDFSPVRSLPEPMLQPTSEMLPFAFLESSLD
jgi:hypothetical protein